jgi:hypothetical protein
MQEVSISAIPFLLPSEATAGENGFCIITY